MMSQIQVGASLKGEEFSCLGVVQWLFQHLPGVVSFGHVPPTGELRRDYIFQKTHDSLLPNLEEVWKRGPELFFLTFLMYLTSVFH